MSFWEKYGGTLFRAWLYFTIPFLGPITEKIVPALLNGNKWPAPQTWLAACILGSAAGLVAVRAFYDGTVERKSQEIKQNGNGNGNGKTNGNGNGHDLTPTPQPQQPKPSTPY